MPEGYEVLAVKYATRETKASEVYLNFHVYREPDFPLTMDYFFWVIRNGRRTIVVDTGFTPETAESHGRTMVTPVPDGLAAVGVDPDSVETVVITHCHYDHTGNTHLFPNAEIVISDRELDFWAGPISQRYLLDMTLHRPDLERLLQWDREGRVRRISGTDEQIPGVVLTEVGGHTPGQMIAMVEGAQGPVLLTSDAVHYYDEVERDWPFLIATDIPEFYEALDVVKDLSLTPGVSYVAGHDPLVMERFAPIDPARPELGVRVP